MGPWPDMRLNAKPSEADEAEGQWHKILAILMIKLKIKFFTITEADIDALSSDPEMQVVLMNARGRELDIEIMSESKARQRAAERGVELK